MSRLLKLHGNFVNKTREVNQQKVESNELKKATRQNVQKAVYENQGSEHGQQQRESHPMNYFSLNISFLHAYMCALEMNTCKRYTSV